jgi:hypothetical protein
VPQTVEESLFTLLEVCGETRPSKQKRQKGRKSELGMVREPRVRPSPRPSHAVVSFAAFFLKTLRKKKKKIFKSWAGRRHRFVRATCGVVGRQRESMTRTLCPLLAAMVAVVPLACPRNPRTLPPSTTRTRGRCLRSSLSFPPLCAAPSTARCRQPPLRPPQQRRMLQAVHLRRTCWRLRQPLQAWMRLSTTP